MYLYVCIFLVENRVSFLMYENLSWVCFSSCYCTLVVFWPQGSQNPVYSTSKDMFCHEKYVHPFSRNRVCSSPSPRTQRERGTLACGWGGGGPNSDDWGKSLALCLLCAFHIRVRLLPWPSMVLYVKSLFPLPPALQRKSRLCIPFLGIALPQSKCPHSCVCERFI